MKTLVEAPPRRKPVNWYRVTPYVTLAVITALLLLNLIYSWDVITSPEDEYGSILGGSQGFGKAALTLLAALTALAVSGVGIVIAFIALLFLVMGIETAWKWWRMKIEETDKKNLTYED